MFLLRVEGHDGTGAYQTGVTSIAHDESCPCRVAEEHPMPEDDAGLCNEWTSIERGYHKTIGPINYRFAFSGPLQYLAWFYSARTRWKLAEAGLLLRVYEVQDEYVAVGTHQVVFAKSRAKRIVTLRPDIEPGALVTLWENMGKPIPIARAA